jgi:RNA-directed DNA polymerase
MGAVATAGASLRPRWHWHQINWRRAHRNVRRLQIRIVQAEQEGKRRKVRALQHILTRSWSGRAVAVKRVTTNRGNRTPGVDHVTWDTPEQKAQAVADLQHQSGRPLPLRRIAIPKSNGGTRYLGIPTMRDRARQALHLLALEPVAETRADPNSYGFRPGRSTADALGQCYCVLSHKTSAPWVLEGDIKACFDEISHAWLLANIPMEKAMLRQWLQAGYVAEDQWYPTAMGTPQGGIISPALANLALDGLERVLAQHFASTKTLQRRTQVHLVRYADDFIITGRTPALLATEVKPVVEHFLRERGLALSSAKTRITHISQGFEFLGQTIRKYGGKFLTRPSPKSIKALLGKVRAAIKAQPQARAGDVIQQLNPLIRGWANYHRHGASAQTFRKVDWHISRMLRRWARRRHPKKSAGWVGQHYFPPTGPQPRVFTGERRNHAGDVQPFRLYRAQETKITRHPKIKGAANPYDPVWGPYFAERTRRLVRRDLPGEQRLLRLWLAQDGRCLVCGQPLLKEDSWHRHHLRRRADGGGEALANLVLLHPNCHRQVHHQGWHVTKPRPVTGALSKARAG